MAAGRSRTGHSASSRWAFRAPHASPADERQFLACAAQRIAAGARPRRPIRAGGAGTRRCRGVPRAGGYRASRTAAGRGSASRKRSQVSRARGADEPALHAERRAVRGGQPRGHRQGDRPPRENGGRGVLRPGRPAGRRREVRDALRGRQSAADRSQRDVGSRPSPASAATAAVENGGGRLRRIVCRVAAAIPAVGGHRPPMAATNRRRCFPCSSRARRLACSRSISPRRSISTTATARC